MQLGYYFFKYWVSLGLFCYYEKIKVVGLENVPLNKPVLLLSNHQNALIDVLLIATHCGLRPWFLTRADVFRNGFLRRLFGFLQMIPIYRIKDGKTSLSKNAAIFDQCGQLLIRDQAILLFPEANHNLERRVRPLSKGFTRIIFNALDKEQRLDLQLVTIGQNYQSATEFPDRTAIYIGKPIAIRGELQKMSLDTTRSIKDTVAENLKKLTTHIDDRENYARIAKNLDAFGVDYTKPVEVNAIIQKMPSIVPTSRATSFYGVKKILIYLINLPMVFLWKVFLKPRVPEEEFMTTFRFGFAMLCYPMAYLVLFVVLSYAFEWKTACLSILGHAALNLLLVKLPTATSSVQKR